MEQLILKSDSENIREVAATLTSLKDSGTIGIATFKNADGEFALYGESRMMTPLEDYLNQDLMLFIKSEADWSWLPLDENVVFIEL